MSDIVILGCGISGALTALTLAQNNIRCKVIEIKSENSLLESDDPRTTALNASSKNFFEQINIWDALTPYIQEIRDIFVCQNMSDDILHLANERESLGFMIPNDIFRNILYKQVQQNPNIDIITESAYSEMIHLENKVSITITTRGKKTKIDASLCIVADGKFSNARKDIFDSRIEKNYNQKAIVFNIAHTKNHEAGAIEHFLPRGTFATLPLVGGFNSGIVWVEEESIADFYTSKDDNFLCDTISRFIGGALGEIKIISKPVSFPLNASLTKKYYNKRLVLIADSAHTIHPLAGQGLNVGIKDVESLCGLIVKHNSLGLEYDESMLEKYQSDRKSDNAKMVHITDTINRVFTTKYSIINKITQKGLSILDKSDILKKTLISYAKGNRVSK
ncbi:MAG: FAD-dependent monooxygenase [Rickettsiaceae bacterium]|nr:FAD-dependent monooxygenase [Rickettsiaceae bacterium]